MPFIFINLIFLFLCFVQSQVLGLSEVAPPLYVFGDSVMDPGNNVFLDTLIKVNFTPYGIDFPGGATGRFTNGFTIADFWYKWSNMRCDDLIPLPYMNPLSKQKSNTKGFNYASGTAGILPDTGNNIGENLPLGQQIRLFELYYNKVNLSQALSKSIFVVCMGSNDYINYLQPGSNTSKSYHANQFGESLAKELKNHLQDLYKMGARKFVVFEIAPLGCLPDVIDKTNPSTFCNEQINSLVSIFNANLGVKLNELESLLQGATFVTAKIYWLIHDIIHNPHFYGFVDSRHPCCASGIDRDGDCKPEIIRCQSRTSHVFWDRVHPTEALYRHIAGECFYGKGLCTPMNIVELAAK